MLNIFSYLFLSVVLGGAVIKIWLAHRQAQSATLNRNVVPHAFADDIPLEAHQKAADYTKAKMKLSQKATVVECALLLALTFGGVLNWAYEVSLMFTNEGVTSALLFFGILVMITSLIELPLDLYKTFVLEEKFGFNKMNLALFFKDLFLGLVVAAIIGGIFISAILWVMEIAGPSWWLYAWALSMGFWFFMQYISPTVLAPLFNKFTPLEDSDLKQRIEMLLHKCGFQSSGLYVMDGSKRSSHGNAYFTGFGKTKRIVFFDTLINKHETNQIEAVLAHELGHFKLNHVLKMTFFLVFISLIFFWALGAAQNEIYLFEGLKINFHSANAMLLAMFYFVLPPFLFFIRPIFAAYLRKNEFEADAYAAKHAPAKDLISALVKLYKDNSSTLTPDTIYSGFYDSHPSASSRIARLQAFNQ